ncbi:SdrD B-like domain-containing protein [Limimaricola hongkongensis]|uniref:SD-repeat containing protein B domain-containing protein n=1 Tax=Limimaricola hongkongensis DSM 17492 TaxID=1122180 RepID=A0A017H7A8_9RHOB|nr:SdrD B-like domain-containing protein [Limimaricola hongkongensis]EYD70417.1 hypothetical protein Lokhon_00171 [Limimaricola hongkongensis DSM 17492]
MTYQKYDYHNAPTIREFTALSLGDLQDNGLSGGVDCGDRFEMPANAGLCVKVRDDDPYLSGDRSYCNDKAADRSYQTARICDGPDGADIGNGGRIYAEKYFQVRDAQGNRYVMIEFEQEGSGANYYTFHSAYGVPQAGARLTVGKSCDLNGNIKLGYDQLDAGDCKPSAPPGDCLVIEAEDMQLYNYKIHALDGASGGEVIKTTSCDPSYAKTVFQGETGTYDLKLCVVDENDGQGLIKIYVGSRLLKSVRLDEDTGGAYGETGVFREITLDDVALSAGDRITIVGVRDGNEFARIDKLEICKDDTPLPAALGDFVWFDADRDGVQDADEAGVAGVTVHLKDESGTIIDTTTTDAQGRYLFDDLAAGRYAVAFEPTDEFEFTTANQGDDATDSDADPGTGMTGLYDLAAGQTDLSADAGLVRRNHAPEPQDDSGKVCATETTVIDVLGNDGDPDGDPVEVAHVAGVAVAIGDSVTLASGATVTLNADFTLSYDSSGASYDGVAAADLLIGETASDSFGYSITDGDLEATAEVDMTICGAKNTLATINASLPQGEVCFQMQQSYEPLINADAITLKLSGTGDARFDGMVYEEAYCLSGYEDTLDVDANGDIDLAPVVKGQMTVAVAANVPAGELETVGINGQTARDNLDLVNWILNQGFGDTDNGDGTGETYNDMEIQGAIWGLTDGPLPDGSLFAPIGTSENAREILDAAIANGEGFEAGEGDIVGLLITPTAQAQQQGHDQPLIIGVAFEALAQDCLCV